MRNILRSILNNFWRESVFNGVQGCSFLDGRAHPAGPMMADGQAGSALETVRRQS